MSLVDALFLDPHSYEAWLAYRFDDVKGTGSLNDPFNCSPRLDTARSVTLLTNSGQVATATSIGHPYNDGDVVTISGDSGPGANRWNGTFIIYDVVVRTSFKYRMTGVPAAASARRRWWCKIIVW
jgi:hypothetical protein